MWIIPHELTHERDSMLHTHSLIGPTTAMRAVIAVGLAIALAAFAGCSTSGTTQSNETSAAASEEASAQASAESSAHLPAPSTKALYALLERETADKLIDLAKDDEDAAWIAAHPDAYEKFGDELQAKLLKLAADDPLAVPFVRNFPKKYPADKPDLDASGIDAYSPSPKVPQTAIPHFYQWDQRWGYTSYSADGFGLAGCGPTALSMVYQGLTGNDDLSPYDMGKLANDNGYVIYDQGTSGAFLTDMASQLGLVWWYVDNTPESIVSTLSDGCLIIANVGAGYFSTVGHYFVLAGVTDDGKIILNDPYSVTRSAQLWDPALISSESVVLYGYALPQ